MRQALVLALLGTETRYVAQCYLTRICIVAFAVSAVVLAIDIAGNFDQVVAASGGQPLSSVAGRVALYLALRLAYNLPAVLPLCVAIGIVWVEWALARGYERTVILNTGRSPFISLAPALLIGLLFGLAQFGALSVIRPMAVEMQGKTGLRYYGPRLSGFAPEPRWIVLKDAVVHAQISFPDDTALLTDVHIFALDPNRRLRATISALSAQLQDGYLRLADPRSWPPEPDATLAREEDLRIDPVWLRNIGIDPRFVPQAELAWLAKGGPGVQGAEFYRAIFQDRLAAGPRLLAMAVLMATLSLALLRPRMSVIPGLKLAAMGYAVHFLLQTLSTLGANAVLPAALAFWAPPGAIVVLCIAYNLRRERAVAKAMAQVRHSL
jgi:lipopolysaccharide export system permease protein